MADQPFQSLITAFYNCAALDSIPGPQQIVDIIREAEGAFLMLGRHHPDPLAYVTSEVNIVSFAIEHPVLRRDRWATRERPLGSADLSFTRSERSVHLSQDVTDADADQIDILAHGQLAFAQHLWPYLRPCYGYFDENGRIIPGGADAVATKVKPLLWANFFGPPYVERLGRDFLLDAPGWKVESLPGGGILYVISSSFTKKGQDVPTKDVEAYFRQRVPRVRVYQPKPLPDY